MESENINILCNTQPKVCRATVWCHRMSHIISHFWDSILPHLWQLFNPCHTAIV